LVELSLVEPEPFCSVDGLVVLLPVDVPPLLPDVEPEPPVLPEFDVPPLLPELPDVEPPPWEPTGG
jgi:hypothetical protein